MAKSLLQRRRNDHISIFDQTKNVRSTKKLQQTRWLFWILRSGCAASAFVCWRCWQIEESNICCWLKKESTERPPSGNKWWLNGLQTSYWQKLWPKCTRQRIQQKWLSIACIFVRQHRANIIAKTRQFSWAKIHCHANNADKPGHCRGSDKACHVGKKREKETLVPFYVPIKKKNTSTSSLKLAQKWQIFSIKVTSNKFLMCQKRVISKMLLTLFMLSKWVQNIHVTQDEIIMDVFIKESILQQNKRHPTMST